MYEADDRPLTEGELTLIGTVIRLADLFQDYIRETPLRDDPDTRDFLHLVRLLRWSAAQVMATQAPDQAWFWTPEWQARERQADADIAAGRITSFDSEEAFEAALAAAAAEHDANV